MLIQTILRSSWGATAIALLATLGGSALPANAVPETPGEAAAIAQPEFTATGPETAEPLAFSGAVSNLDELDLVAQDIETNLLPSPSASPEVLAPTTLTQVTFESGAPEASGLEPDGDAAASLPGAGLDMADSYAATDLTPDANSALADGFQAQAPEAGGGEEIAQGAGDSEGPTVYRTDGIYINFFGSPIMNRQFAEDFIGRATFKTGYEVGGAVGYRLGDFRADFEIHFFRNEFDELTFFQPGTTISVLPAQTSPGSIVDGQAYMFNLYYDIPITERLRPYVGGGLGVYTANISNLSPPGFGGFVANGNSPARFAFQLRAGVSYAVIPNLDLYTGYRFFKGNQFRYTIENSQALTPDGSLLVLEPNGLQSHSWELGVRYTF